VDDVKKMKVDDLMAVLERNHSWPNVTGFTHPEIESVALIRQR